METTVTYGRCVRIIEEEKLIKKWGRVGLLQGIEDENKKYILARLLENEAIYLVAQSMIKDKEMPESMVNYIFPIVRRLPNEGIEDFDAQWLFEDFKTYHEKWVISLGGLTPHVDWECGMIVDYIKDVSKRIPQKTV